MKSGVYCLHKITESYGMSLSQEDIARRFYSIKEIDVLELETVAERIGFKTLLVPFLNWKELLQIPLPAILFKFNEELDFILIEEMTKISMTIYNPKVGKRRKVYRFSFNSYYSWNLMLLYPQ